MKHGLGQVYLDRSRKPAPDDFQNDLVQLRRSAVCDSCDQRDACTGLYEPIFEDVFGRDDARVLELVRGLRGDVLDVGCGEGPYAATLAGLAKSGDVRYVGIDPDAGRIARLQKEWGWAELHATTAEEFVAASAGRAFDHILILRSWNHLSDPSSVVTALRQMLRPGGSLLVVDNSAFGLARTQAQTTRGEKGPAIFEHFRNDTAEDAKRTLGDLGMSLVEQREVSPATSNQWLLRFVQPDV